MRFIISIFFLALFSLNAQDNIQSYEFKFTIENTENDTLYLANYLGKKLYYYDTAYANNKGVTIFKGNEIPPGVYAVVTKGPKYFELIINEPKIELETSTDNFVSKMKIINSDENKAFYEYINYVNRKKIESIPLSKKYNDSSTSEEEKKTLKIQLDTIDKKVKYFQKTFDEKYKGNLFAADLMAINYDVIVPDTIQQKDKYFYYKSHFFDRLDLNNDRFARSPAFMNKIEKYFTQVLPQNPDSIYLAAYELADKIVDTKSDAWKLIVHYVTNKFEQSKQMGMDKVLVKMAQKYYCTEDSLAYWMPKDKLIELCEKAEVTQHLLIGEKTPNIILQDTTEENWINLHKDVKTKWTVLIFWDPECGHCKEEIPKINDFYLKVRDSISLSIVGVGGVLETDKWKKFIKDNELDWIHISDNPEINENAYQYLNKTTIKSLNFRQTYDIFSYPQVYLLDENKIIRAKKIGAENIEKLVLELDKRNP